MKNTNYEIINKPESSRRGLLSPSTRENIKIYWYKFSRNKLSLVGLGIVLISVFFAIFAPFIVPYPQHIYEFVDFSKANLPPCSDFWFGTDIYGRDVFSRVIYSFRSAILMSVVVLGIATPFGTMMGLIAGYYNGTIIDTLIMRITDVFLAVPALVLALAIASVMEPSLMGSMIAVTVMWWTWYARMVYGIASSTSKEYFVINAELIGASKLHILFNEILPCTLSPVLTKMALDVGWVILIGASLSFAGLGEQPPNPAFGTMINEGAKNLPELWWIAVFPALGIAFVILGFNFLGDGIRDMLDRGRQ
jgi:peptide/nickel transport system permease protein